MKQKNPKELRLFLSNLASDIESGEILSDGKRQTALLALAQWIERIKGFGICSDVENKVTCPHWLNAVGLKEKE